MLALSYVFCGGEMKRDYGTNGNKRNKRKSSNPEFFLLFRNLSSFHGSDPSMDSAAPTLMTQDEIKKKWGATDSCDDSQSYLLRRSGCPGQNVGQDQECRPGQSARGQQSPVLRPDDETHNVWNLQPDEADDAAHGNGRAREERRARQDDSLCFLDVRAYCESRLFTEQQHIQLARIDERNE